MKLFQAVFRWYRADWPRVLLALGLAIVAVGLGLLKPWPLAVIVDRLGGGSSGQSGLSKVGELPVLLGFLFSVYVAHAVINAGMNWVLIDTGLRGLRRVRAAVFDWLLGLSLRRLWGSEAGDILYRATWDTFSFQTLFHHGGFTLVTAAGSLLAMTVVMWRLNLTLTLVALATVPPLLGVMHWFGREMAGKSAAAQAADTRLASRLQQAVANLAVLQSFTAERMESERFDAESAAAHQARRRQHRQELAYLAVVGGIFALGTTGIVGFGVREVEAGRLSVGRFLVFLAYLTQFYEPLNQLSNVGTTVSQARAGAGRVLEMLERPPELAVPTGPASLPPARGGRAVTFERVTFRYGTGLPALLDVELELRAGETVALVGPSGAGKSTLLQMVPRFLDPETGAVRFDGVDLRTMDPRAVRGEVALVPQESPLLAGTVAENLRLGRAGASQADLEAAARLAQAHEFIERLPQGYETVVGDGAGRLSVGERQRLNLARAFLKNAPILLLDEPTSALDPGSEALVLTALAELCRGRTTLMVAHRLRTLERVDRVAVLNGGRIVEIATPAQLLQGGGWFARMREQPG